MIEYLFLIITLLSSSSSVLIFKKVAKDSNFSEGYLVAIKSLINKYTFLTMILVVISIFFYTLALSKIPLAFAYSFATSINTLLVVMGGYLFYRELINKKQLIGIILVILGLFLFNF